MDVSRITSQHLIGERLDANYYGTQFLKNEAFMKKCGLPFERIGSLAVKCNCGATPKEVDYDGAGQGLIRTSDVRPNYFAIDKVLRTSELQVRPESNVAALADDLLYTMSGTIGYAAVIPETEETFSFSNTIARVRFPKGKPHDPRFMATFFNCKYGYKQSLRLVSGGIQGHVMPNPFKNLLVPTPHSLAQTYIGEKVRQAERLRERARNLEISFQAAIQALYPDIFGPVRAVGKSSRTDTSSLGGSLNPGAYNPERLRIRQYIEERRGKRLSSVASVDTPVSDSYQPSDTYVGLDSISSSTCAIAPSTIASGEVEGAVRVLRAGPIISKLRPYLNKATYIPPELAGAFGSTELLCVMPFSDVSGWFLYGVLKLESTIRQLNPIATGSTHPRASRADVLELMLPWAENQEELGARLEFAQQAYFTAERLITAAKLMVEALIEGKVTEGEFREAQEGLERGDVSADRELLARVTRKGIDVMGEAPLFPDLNALYQALEQVTVTDGQLQEA